MLTWFRPTQSWAANPFVSHAFLSALERSGSATPRTGWAPQHLLAETRDGELVGAVPCYLKSHSRGEYVFDQGWADAYERAGGNYYPKLQVSVPFTPATGPRLLVKPSPHADADQGRAGGRPCDAVRTPAGLIRPRHLPAGTGLGSARRQRLSEADRPAIPLAQRRLCDLRGFSLRPRLPQAQGHPSRAPGRDRQRHHHSPADRARSDRSGVGRLLRLLYRHRFAQMGAALSHPRVLFTARRRRWRTGSCW